mmetsp:Transcript_6405/g.22687  ORF Transcript_6405/g.22687 Transcript_6405/m.22687 type:complete len:303 (-) Transcript_6405:29-937(-)
MSVRHPAATGCLETSAPIDLGFPVVDSSGTAVAAGMFAVGTVVTAVWTDGYWYRGVVERFDLDGCYKIHFWDGTQSSGVPADEICPLYRNANANVTLGGPTRSVPTGALQTPQAPTPAAQAPARLTRAARGCTAPTPAAPMPAAQTPAATPDGMSAAQSSTAASASLASIVETPEVPPSTVVPPPLAFKRISMRLFQASSPQDDSASRPPPRRREVEGWIAARLGARRDDDWSGLCHTQDVLQRGMNYSVQRASPPGVGRPKNVALTVDTYKVTWVMLRKRPRPQRVQAPADGTPVRVEMVE